MLGLTLLVVQESTEKQEQKKCMIERPVGRLLLLIKSHIGICGASKREMHDRETSRSIVTVNQEPYWNL